MARNRHLSRIVGMQSLYEWEFRNAEETPADLQEITTRNIGEFGKDVADDFVWRIVNHVVMHQAAIDQLLAEAAPDWPLDQIARVDRNILRVATYEMLFDEAEDVPPRVAINEAIEIAKVYGSPSSPKFINGVLGYIYRKFEEKLAPRDANRPTPQS